MAKPVAKLLSMLTPKRRWAQFSLATFLLIVAAICAFLGSWADRAYRQRMAVQILRRRNVLVVYDFEQKKSVESAWRTRLRRFLGDEYVADVVRADLSVQLRDVVAGSENVSDQGRSIADARGGQVIWLDSPSAELSSRWIPPATPKFVLKPYLRGDAFYRPDSIQLEVWPLVDDDAMRCVGCLRGLERLDLTGISIGDAGLAQLSRLSKLRDLDLLYTTVADTGIDAGLRHLQGLTGLKILNVGENVTDVGLVHLRALTGLEQLLIVGNQVTDTGVAELKKALPECRIAHY